MSRFKKKEISDECDCSDRGIGMYGDLSIYEVQCSHIPEYGKTFGSCICDCLDFPDNCKICHNNKYKPGPGYTVIEDTRKHYFKPKERKRKHE